MNDKLKNQRKDAELRSHAEAFLTAFLAAAASSAEEAQKIFRSKGGFTIFAGGVVELTEEIGGNLSKLVWRAAKLLGAKAGNEKALREIAMGQAQEAVRAGASASAAVPELIDALFEEGSAKFQFLVPNYLVAFTDGARAVEIGRVRAMLTEDFAAELAETPHTKVQVVPDEGFAIEFTSGSNAVVHIHPRCWVVAVDAAKDNVEEEAKWLIDIAVGFLRLHYTQATPRFPNIGTVEPHPLVPPEVAKTGIKITDAAVSLGESSVPPAYEVGPNIVTVAQDAAFKKKAALIFDPKDKSLAARVAQGLGWLTRGRQAKDRSERLLYFFTAIESLLSGDDKSAPVVQNIARQAAVLLTDDNAARAELAADTKKLYALRSGLVHAGSRGVLWNNANTTEYLAEAVFHRVLGDADLSMSHATFLNGLSQATYGLPWPSTPAESQGQTDGE